MRGMSSVGVGVGGVGSGGGSAPAEAPLASGEPWSNLGLLTVASIGDPTILKRGHSLLCAGFVVAGISSFRGEGTMLSSGATS